MIRFVWIAKRAGSVGHLEDCRARRRRYGYGSAG